MATTHYIILGMLTAYGAAAAALICGALMRGNATANKINAVDALNSDDLPGVSVVIPFRNEKHNLNALLDSIYDQNYKGPLEVIFVDDASEDGGADIIKNYRAASDRINIKIIDLHTCDVPFEDVSRFKDLTTKQQALDIGVANASHHLAAFTDADMVLSPDWIKSLVNTWLSTDADLVFGHTSVINNGKPLSAAESYQLEFLFAFAYAFAKLDLTGSCMGNNILVVKDAYTKCGGQRGAGYSVVEDRALLKRMRRLGCKTAPAVPFHPTAKTYPARSVSQFLNQTARWAAGGLRPGSGLFIAGLLMLTQNGIFLLSAAELIAKVIFPVAMSHGVMTGILLPHSPTATVIPIPIMAMSAINFLTTWAFLHISFKRHRSPASMRYYPAFFLFVMVETIAFGWMMLFKPTVKWKDRKLKV